MIVQVHHDNHVQGSAEQTAEVRDLLEGQLARFADQITRVLVQLSDESGAAKSGFNAKRCLLEARLGGLEPLSVTDRGNSPEEAIRGATNKLEALIESTLGKLHRRHRPIHGQVIEAEEEIALQAGRPNEN